MPAEVQLNLGKVVQLFCSHFKHKQKDPHVQLVLFSTKIGAQITTRL